MPQYFAGEQWTDETFRAWVAGLIDRGATFRPEQAVFSVSCADAEALHGVRDFFGVGDVEQHPTIDRLTIWRIRRGADAALVLSAVFPFLTVKRDAARRLVDRVAEADARRQLRADRNRKIIALRMGGGLSHAEIAESVGSSPQVVAQVIGVVSRQVVEIRAQLP